MKDLVPEMPEEERDWFCPECGIRDAGNRGIDVDGTCSGCGAGCCRMSHLRTALAAAGYVVQREGRKDLRFDGQALTWPGGGMNLSMLRALLATRGLHVIEAERPTKA